MGTLIEGVEVEPGYRLKDYAEYNYLAPQVANLEAAARKAVPRLADRTIWIVSSTRRGGGVAEGLPRIVSLMRQLGLSVEWASIHSPDPAFFPLTKRIHNQLHGMGRHGLGRSDRELYDTVSDQLADALANDISSQDILIVHDPQPLGTGARVKKKRGVPAIWRCHTASTEPHPQVKRRGSSYQPTLRPTTGASLRCRTTCRLSCRNRQLSCLQESTP